jgi:sugar-specific transcriptional regulator TrmB
MEQTTVTALKSLDFTEYEAKAYLALLDDAPLTGYAVAKQSGVPRSKIYEVLEALAVRGDIIVSHEATPQYTPVSPKDLISMRKAKAEANYRLAERSLARYQSRAGDRGHIWNITGYASILQKVKGCIGKAKRRILLEIWAEDFPALAEELQRTAERGVSITVIAYGDIQVDFADVYLHDMSEEITEEYGGRWLVFSADDHEVVAGVISLGDSSRAAWTMHQGLVMPITEVMIHDLYIMEIMRELRPELEHKFGKNLMELRHKFASGPDHRKQYL